MQEHIHVPAHDEEQHQPAWSEPSRDAEGIGPFGSIWGLSQERMDKLRARLRARAH